MNDFDFKRKEIKDRASTIINHDRNKDTLEEIIHNHPKDKMIEEKHTISKEEFFNEKEGTE